MGEQCRAEVRYGRTLGGQRWQVGEKLETVFCAGPKPATGRRTWTRPEDPRRSGGNLGGEVSDSDKVPRECIQLLCCTIFTVSPVLH